MPRGVTSLPGSSTGTARQVMNRLIGFQEALATTAEGSGAELIGFSDTADQFAGTTVATAIEEGATEFQAYRDQLVAATITVPDVVGGATAAALTLSLVQAQDGTTPVASARQVLIRALSQQYQPVPPFSNTVTFLNATTGSIVASGNGWALVLTSAAGLFACTANNTTDETVHFRVLTADAISTLTQRCMVVGCVPDAATWSA